MTIEFPLVIDGKWREGSAKAGEDVLNPATGDSIGEVAHASTADLDEALDAAARGLREWRAVPPWQRGAVLKDAGRPPARRRRQRPPAP